MEKHKMSEMNIDAFNKKREKWQQLVESEEINAIQSRRRP